MAGKGISINFLANVRDFIRGTDNVDASLDKVAGSLDDLAHEGADAGDRLERSLNNVERETEEARKTFRDMGRAVEDAGSVGARAMRRLDDSTATATRGARAGLRDLKDESRQTARESAASFDGSARSIVDAFQEVAANAFIGFGPAGLAAGLAAAAGIGLIAATLESGQQKATLLKARVAELTVELIAAGKDGGPSLDYLVDRIKALATETDDGAVSLKKLREVSDGNKGSFKELAQAYAGNVDELDELIRKNEDYLDTLYLQRDVEFTNANRADVIEGIQKKIDAQEKYISYLGEAGTAATAAAEQERNYVEAGGPELERKAVLISAINDAYDQAAGSVDDYIDKETGLFDVAAYITAMQSREKALRDYQTTLATSGLSEEAKGFLNAQGADAAALFLDGYKKGSPQQRAELERLWSEAAASDSGTYTDELAAAFSQAPVPGPSVVPQLDTVDLDRQLAALASRTVNVTVQLRDPLGRKIP